MKQLLILVVLTTVQVCSAATPQLFREKTFTAVSIAEAVNHFVDLGEVGAVQELRGMAQDSDTSFQQGFNTNERIGWICRVLFEAKDGKSLRPPAFGGLNLPYHTMPLKSWPLFPVAFSGSTYFVLSEGYTLAGRAERAQDYIDYCQQTGVFRTKPVGVPSKTEALKDVASLRQSAAWRVIKWTDKGEGWSHVINEEWVWKFIQDQAESIR